VIAATPLAPAPRSSRLLPAGVVIVPNRILPRLLCAALLGLSANVTRATSPEPPPAMPQAAAADLSTFAWRFQRQLGSEAGNQVFSPLSIASVFAMLSAGARGETAAELRQALAFSGADQAWHASQGALARELSGLQREGSDWESALTLRLVNDLWLQQGFAVGEDFLATLQQHYGSQPTQLDFAADAEAARRRINARIDEATGALIPELLPQGSVGAEARLVLTNALYFKAAWDSPFSESGTRPAPFHALDGSEAEVPMMRVTNRFAYAQGEDWQAIRLPYAGDALEMLVLVPAPGRFAAVAERLDADTVAAILAATAHTRIRLHFPKFSLRTALPLVPALQQAGLRRIFTEAAELDGIAPNLFVSAALHEAVVEVDEAGTEAAAATAAVISLTSMPMPEPDPLELRIDRPFLFVIRATASGAPLFIGRYVQPE
jgi:serpin B